MLTKVSFGWNKPKDPKAEKLCYKFHCVLCFFDCSFISWRLIRPTCSHQWSRDVVLKHASHLCSKSRRFSNQQSIQILRVVPWLLIKNHKATTNKPSHLISKNHQNLIIEAKNPFKKLRSMFSIISSETLESCLASLTTNMAKAHWSTFLAHISSPQRSLLRTLRLTRVEFKDHHKLYFLKWSAWISGVTWILSLALATCSFSPKYHHKMNKYKMLL